MTNNQKIFKKMHYNNLVSQAANNKDSKVPQIFSKLTEKYEEKQKENWLKENDHDFPFEKDGSINDKILHSDSLRTQELIHEGLSKELEKGNLLLFTAMPKDFELSCDNEFDKKTAEILAKNPDMPDAKKHIEKIVKDSNDPEFVRNMYKLVQGTKLEEKLPKEIFNVQIEHGYLGSFTMDCRNYELSEEGKVVYTGPIKDGQIVSPIPDGIKSIDGMFKDNKELKYPPRIPKSVISMEEAFMGNENLREMAKFPPNIEWAESAYEGCVTMEKVKAIPKSMKDACYMLKDCVALKNEPSCPEHLNAHHMLQGTRFDYNETMEHQTTELSGKLEKLNEKIKNNEKYAEYLKEKAQAYRDKREHLYFFNPDKANIYDRLANVAQKVADVVNTRNHIQKDKTLDKWEQSFSHKYPLTYDNEHVKADDNAIITAVINDIEKGDFSTVKNIPKKMITEEFIKKTIIPNMHQPKDAYYVGKLMEQSRQKLSVEFKQQVANHDIMKDELSDKFYEVKRNDKDLGAFTYDCREWNVRLDPNIEFDYIGKDRENAVYPVDAEKLKGLGLDIVDELNPAPDETLAPIVDNIPQDAPDFNEDFESLMSRYQNEVDIQAMLDADVVSLEEEYAACM